jgi:hypothetical protein
MVSAGGMVLMKYQSGEVVLKGDKVLFHGEPGEVEYVVDKLVGDPEMDWNMRVNGPGVMILEPKHFGRVYMLDTENAEDLVLVERHSVS